MLKDLTLTRATIININNEEVMRSDKNSDDNIHDNQEDKLHTFIMKNCRCHHMWPWSLYVWE